MRRVAFLFLMFPLAVSAQEDCELFNLQDLAKEIQALRAENDSLSCLVGVEMDGYRYKGVPIGDQCWFAENLRTTVYADGSAIPEVTDNNAWSGLSTGARCAYDNNLVVNYEYGLLYNWYAVDDSRGLCPSGWHVPSDGEWTELENYITAQGFAGTEGMALKSTTGWNGDGNGTDDFGFTALPGGYRNVGGSFNNVGNYGRLWSAYPNGGNAWLLALNYDSPGTFLVDYNPLHGFSVRCLRDAE